MMVLAGGILSPTTTVRFQANGTPPPETHSLPPSRSPSTPGRPLLSIPKPSWIVKTERKDQNRILHVSFAEAVAELIVMIVVAKSLVGRTNNVELAMLPSGEWPKWCKTCGGSGLAYCSRCLGTGEYRYLMGFHFMKKDEHEAQVGDRGNYKVRDMLRARKRAEDLLPNDDIA